MNKKGIINRHMWIPLAAVMLIILIPLLASAIGAVSPSLLSGGATAPSFSARVSCAVEEVTAGYDKDSVATVTFTLSEKCDVPVSFDYTVLLGSAGTDLLDFNTDTGIVTSGTVTFAAGETVKTVKVPVKRLVHKPTGEYPQIGSPDELWNGDRVFFVSCTNIQNALFTDTDDQDCWELVVPVKVTSEVNFGALYENATAALIDLGETLRYSPDAEEPYDVSISARIDPNGPVRKLLDAGVLTSLTLPTGKLVNSGSAGGPVEVRLERPAADCMSAILLYSNSIDFPEGETTLSLGSAPLGSNEGFNVLLGPAAEENGMITDMDLVFAFPSSDNAAVTFDSANQLFFTDGTAPTVEYWEQGGDLLPMRTVPITLTFSEPVKASGVALTVTPGTANPVTLSPVESTGTISNKLSFLYTVGDSVSDLTCSLSGVKDLSGKGFLDDEPSREFTLSGSAAQSPPRMLLAGLSSSVTLNTGIKEAMEGEITLSLKNNGELRTWVSSKLESESAKWKCSALKARVVAYDADVETGVASDIPLYADNNANPNELTGSFTAPENHGETDIKYIAEIYYTPADSDPQLLYPLCEAYTVPPLRYIESADDLTVQHKSWPESRAVRTGDDGLSMGYSCPKGLPTWNGPAYFKWSSNNTAVATINEATGVISLTGTPGKVRFTLTVTNPINDDAITVTGDELTVRATDAAFLRVPDALQLVELPYGSSAIISFSSDLGEKNADYAGNPNTATAFTLNLYSADDSAVGGLPAKDGDALWTGTLSSTTAEPKKSFTVPAEYLTVTTAPGKYGYVAEISAVALDTGETLTAQAYLRVLPRQAHPKLERPKKLYMTDAQIGNAVVQYTIENYSEGNTKFELFVRRNSETDSCCSADNYTQSASFDLPDVDNGHRLDTYTVSLKARNNPGDPWAFDSYTFYVYSADALKPQINGITQSSCKLTLPESINNRPLEKLESSQLVDNRANLTPKASLSLSAAYPWSTSADKFTCAVTGGTEGGLLLKLREDGVTRTLEADTLCSPNSSISLVGIRPGEYKVTTTHVLTGAQNTITVTVEDVSDKLLYLKSAQGISLNVTCKGETQTIYNGQTLALYDPDGLGNQGITIAPYDGEDKLSYQPTVLYPSAFRDNQRVWVETGVYPVTSVNLDKISSTKRISFYTEDRNHKLTPYNGYVKVAAGIHSYGVYIEGTKYADNTLCAQQRIQKTTNEVSYDSDENPSLDCYITLDYDHASILESSRVGVEEFDKLTYGFELIPCDEDGDSNEDLLPVLTRQSGDQFKVVFQEKAESWLPPDCSLISQSIYQYSAERDFTDVIYLNSGDPWDMKLVTRLLVPQSAASEYTTYVLDETGAKCMGSNYIEDNPYGELSTLVSRVDIGTAYIYSMRWGIDPAVETGEILRLYPVFSNADGTEVYNFPTPVRIQNLFGVPDMYGMATAGGAMADIMDMVFKIIDMSNQPGYDERDDNAKSVLDYLKSMRLNPASKFSTGLEVRATDDPLVYGATLRMAMGEYASSNPPGVFLQESSDTNFSFSPGLSDMKAMAKGTFLQESKKTFYESTSGYRSREKIYGGGVYMDGIVYYDIQLREWCFAPYSTSAYLGGGIKMAKAYNFKMGPVPCTIKTEFTGTAETGFKIFTNRGEGLDNANIMSLLPQVTLRVSGGVGADYDVVALMAGPYGEVTHNQQYLWQNWEGGWANGQKLTVSGEAGITLRANLAFIEYKDDWELVSYDWNKTYNKFDEINENYTGSVFNPTLFSAGEIIPVGEDYALVPVRESAGFETRDYLTAFERRWTDSSAPMLLSLLTPGTLTAIQENAYPKAAPILTEDGELMVYLHDGNSTDLNKITANYALRSDAGGALEDKGAIDGDESHPDSGLTVAGTKSHAAAAWVRSDPISTTAGAAATDEEILAMLTGAEIMTSVFDGTSWTTEKLTDDTRLDMPPAVAASEHGAVVAWISATPCDLENPLASSDNRVMVSFHNGTGWSTPAVLLDAGADSVSNISAAMLPDGSAAVSFLRGNTVVCATLNASGEVISLLNLAEDATGEVQLTAAKFPDETTRYVIGWNGEDETVSPVLRLAAVNADGTLYSDFSVELAHESGYHGFKFSKGTDDVTGLSILWSAADASEISETGQYPTVVFGQKLTRSGSSYSAAMPQELLRLDSGVSLCSLDGVTGDGNSFQFMLTSTDAEGKTNISRTDAEYENNGITIEEPIFDYAEVMPGAETTVQFSVTNDGLAPITKIEIELGGKKHTFDSLSVASGESETASVIYSVPVAATLSDADYTVTAFYASGTAVESGKLAFSLPDIRMDDLTLKNETGGERQFDLTLGMPTYAPPADSQNIYVQVSATSDFSELVHEHELTEAEINALKSNGSLRMSLTLNLTHPVFSGFLSDGELPEGGLWLYFRTVLAEDNADPEKADVVVEDADSSNDYAFRRLVSLAEQMGRDVSIGSVLTTGDGTSSVRMGAFNNTLSNITNGNLVVSLLDEDGSVLETKQTYTPGNADSLISVGGESAADDKTLTFTQAGTAVDVRFARVTGGSTKLSVLNLTGVPLTFAPETYSYTLQSYDITETLVSAVTEDPSATVSARLDGQDVSLTSPLPLSVGEHSLVVTVSGSSGSTAYTLMLVNSAVMPTAVFTATGPDTGTLTGVTADMKYSTDGNNWTDITGTTVALTGLSACTIKVVKKGDGSTTADSPEQSIVVTRAETPSAGKTDCTTVSDNDGTLTGVTAAMEWQKTGGSWADGTGSTITNLTNGTYYVRVKATGTVLASDSQELTIASYTAPAPSNNGGSSTLPLVTSIQSGGSLSGANLDQLIAQGKELMVEDKNTGAALKFDTVALKGIDRETSDSVKVEIKDVSAEHQDTLAGKAVFSLSVTSGDKTISSFGGSVIVSLPYELKDGENAENVAVWYLAEDGTMTEVPCTYDAKTKLATFTVSHFSEYVVGVKNWVNPFADVKEADWFYDDVAFVNANGLMNGVDAGIFDPHGTTTRGMIVTMLYRLEGEPAITGANPFDDVASGKYYENAVTWAAVNKIVDGYGDNKFGPDDSITREQMAAILYRYEQYKGGGFTGAWMFRLNYPDAAAVSEWAYEAMCWCTMNEIIGGNNDGTLAPQGDAERCQVAAILHRFIDKDVK